jgi:hypothetical protein
MQTRDSAELHHKPWKFGVGSGGRLVADGDSIGKTWRVIADASGNAS